ncbi:hypothetical protein [Tsukamurella sp. NPDC003166]|uniref:hypothetical protein n=1 Tax=Tsukamurella sp. NPDC003166 TaxID=3154444 RepID=UPI0033B9CF8A
MVNPARILAAITGVLGIAGLGLTMLPLLTIKATDVQLQFVNPGIGPWSFYGGYGGGTDMTRYCTKYPDECVVRGAATAHIGFLDIGPMSVAMVAIIPIVLGLVGALGALQAVRGMHPGGAAGTALLALGALVVAVFTWISPGIAVSGTGEFATAKSSGYDTGMSVSPGAGLICAAIALIAILAVGGYQAITEMLARR